MTSDDVGQRESTAYVHGSKETTTPESDEHLQGSDELLSSSPLRVRNALRGVEELHQQALAEGATDLHIHRALGED